LQVWPVDVWKRVLRHSLLSFYLHLPRRSLPARLARISVGAVWGGWLVATALAVHLYPQATDVTCSGYSCRFPLSGPGSPLYDLNDWLGAITGLALLALLPLLGVAALLRMFVQGLRGRWTNISPPFTLASSWDTDLITLLVLTPLTPGDLIRIRVLSRLYSAWRQRAWLALGLGVGAALGVSEGVVRPPFWMLGAWQNWLVLLGIVALWGLVLGVWVMVFCVFAVLDEVTHSSQRVMPGLSWSAVTLLLFSVSVLAPPLVMLSMTTYFNDPPEWLIQRPLVIGLLGLFLGGIDYCTAQILFRLRLHTRLRS
jgi:hypothetical protein